MKFKIDVLENVFKGFYDLVKTHVSHEKFDGGEHKNLERVLIVKKDAVCVTLIDPKHKKILFVKQFRPASAYNKAGFHGWPLEPVAGHIEHEEDVFLAAQREVFEETGLEIKDFILHSKSFTCAGIMTELHYNLYGYFDSELYQPKSGIGVIEEQEDIEVLVLSYEEAKQHAKESFVTESFLVSLLIINE